METDIDDNYKVEHGEDFSLNEEQVRKLIEAKFARNNVLHRLVKQRERQVQLAE